MPSLSELSGSLKRSSSCTYERALLLLSCLDARDAQPKLSEGSLTSLLAFALPGTTPRLLTCLSINNKVARSSDKGSTWKELPMTNTQDEEGSIENTTLTHLSCFKDIVVIGGLNGSLYVSMDRGVHFTPTNVLQQWWQDEPQRNITSLCILNTKTIIVSNSQHATSVSIAGTYGSDGLQRVSFGELKHIYSSRGGIHYVDCVPFLSSLRELVVSEDGMLSVSYNGVAFLSFRHHLGTIRCCNNFHALRNTELPAFPSNSQILRRLQKNDTETSGTKQYEYSLAGGTANAAESVLAQKRYHHWASAANVSYRSYFVVGVGSSVLPYDYSAVLHLGVFHGDEAPIAFSIAEKVQYIPYSKSSLSQPLLCEVCRLPKNSPFNRDRSTVCVRGSSAGISLSTDYVKWSSPHASSPVALIPSDGDEVIGCTQRNVLFCYNVSQDGQPASSRSIPAELRMPALVAVEHS